MRVAVARMWRQSFFSVGSSSASSNSSNSTPRTSRCVIVSWRSVRGSWIEPPWRRMRWSSISERSPEPSASHSSKRLSTTARSALRPNAVRPSRNSAFCSRPSPEVSHSLKRSMTRAETVTRALRSSEATSASSFLPGAMRPFLESMSGSLVAAPRVGADCDIRSVARMASMCSSSCATSMAARAFSLMPSRSTVLRPAPLRSWCLLRRCVTISPRAPARSSGEMVEPSRRMA
mmetsp:Transcript_66692/g.182933  ORF Transcript_66692/g.182933 Transcript_66692/m.182933 type:complete len:233 (-) Transcript_66692:139-837(-)